jgi:hypothetical protein
MKKKLLVGFALLGLAGGLSMYAEETQSPSKDVYAEIVFVQGSDLLVLRSDGKALSEDPIGVRMYAGDQVQTGSKTSVELMVMPRRARMRLSENTVITIGALENDGSTTLKLLYGRIRSKVEKLAGSSTPYNVVTRSFVAGVRGTDFGCDLVVPRAGELSSSKVYCFEGSVEVSPTAQVAQGGAESTDRAGSEGEAAFKPVLVNAGAMAVIDESGQGKAIDVVERPIDVEIKTFWRANEFTATQPTSVEQSEQQEASTEQSLDLAPIKNGIKTKNRAIGGALVLFASGVALDVASYMIRKDNADTADGLLCGAAVCASMGLPLMIYSIALNPLKGVKR